MNTFVAQRVGTILPRRAAQCGHTCVPLRAVVAVAICTFALASCGSPQAPQSPVTQGETATSASPSARSDTQHQNSPFAIPPAGTAAAAAGARNYQDLLKHYSEAKQALIKAWFQKHAAGSMAFRSNAQWQWMQQHDYPTPDDVLRASTMPEAQLRELAIQGDTKADYFYLARLIDDYTQAGATPAASSHDKPRLQAEMTASMDRALASGSAFAGYLFGGYYAALHGEQAGDIGEAAGVIWADSFGDSNAVFLNQQATMNFPGVSGVRAAEVSFDMFAAAARANPYFLNARHGKGDLSIPLQ